MNIGTMNRLAITVAIGTVLAATSIASLAEQRSDDSYQHQDESKQDKQQKQEDKAERQDQKDTQKAKQQQQRRLSQQQQQEHIRRQKQSMVQYNQHIAHQQAVAQRRAQQLQQQKRMAHYRFQQAYYERLRQQQLRLENDGYDYDSDPFYYTAPSYRYRRGSIYYETNQYGVDVLRQALNNGYEEGIQAGLADQQDKWRFDYQQSFAYQDANFGYDGRHVQQDDYNYYFREGFQRGYDDGYKDRRAYGRNNASGPDTLLGAVIETILGLQSLQ